MQPRPRVIALIAVRILTAVAFCFALNVGLERGGRAQSQSSARTQEAIKPQTQQPPVGVQELANRLASEISRITFTNRERILVLDFKGPDGHWLPFSAWLADQFRAALGKAGDRLEVVPRSDLTAALADRHLEPKDTFDTKTVEALAESLEAQMIVSGNFAATENALDILVTYSSKDGDSWLVEPWKDCVRGEILLPSEVSASFGITLDSLRSRHGVYRTGQGGFSPPSCIHCPHPQYTAEAVAKKYEGTIVLLVTISDDGRAVDVKVTKKLAFGLDEQAVNAVRNWKFKPATDVDGEPVLVRMPVVISFGLH